MGGYQSAQNGGHSPDSAMPAEKREGQQQAIKHDRYGRRDTGHVRGGCLSVRAGG